MADTCTHPQAKRWRPTDFIDLFADPFSITAPATQVDEMRAAPLLEKSSSTTYSSAAQQGAPSSTPPDRSRRESENHTPRLPATAPPRKAASIDDEQRAKPCGAVLPRGGTRWYEEQLEDTKAAVLKQAAGDWHIAERRRLGYIQRARRGPQKAAVVQGATLTPSLTRSATSTTACTPRSTQTSGHHARWSRQGEDRGHDARRAQHMVSYEAHKIHRRTLSSASSSGCGSSRSSSSASSVASHPGPHEIAFGSSYEIVGPHNKNACVPSLGSDHALVQDDLPSPNAAELPPRPVSFRRNLWPLRKGKVKSTG